MSLILSSLLFLAYAFFVYRRLLRYLHIFQQEEYDSLRFLKWIGRTGSFDKRLSLGLVLALFVMAGFNGFLEEGVERLILGALFFFSATFEKDPRKTAKKKLVMTQRAGRIFVLGLAACFVAGLFISFGEGQLLWIFAIQAVPLTLVLANMALVPIEAFIQKRILKEASSILSQFNPRVVGITGSFGKTSVKHILGHVLGLNAPTLFTPGSVNTLMGISRVIREKLTPSVQFFLVEMGAYGKGSIERLCRLAPPDVGIITALGDAHYERFGSLDAVARAKFELAQAVLLKEGGKIVIHESVLAQEYARNFVEKNRDKFFICGRLDSADVKINSAEQTTKGLSVSVQWGDASFVLFAPLYGAAHADNLALAFGAGVVCGISPDRIVGALRTVPQIVHRLEVRPLSLEGPVYIDDAYNSNPRGFEAALEVLSLLGQEKSGRRILVTPGIVELGTKNEEIHWDLGVKAAQRADIVFVVRPDRIPSFGEGFRSVAGDKGLHFVKSFQEAHAWLVQNAQAPDVILLENDLPDVDEAKLVL